MGTSLFSSRSLWSVLSWVSVLSVASAASLLSIGSFASILSIGSSGSVLSIGSSGSFLGIGTGRYPKRIVRRLKTGASREGAEAFRGLSRRSAEREGGSAGLKARSQRQGLSRPARSEMLSALLQRAQDVLRPQP
jgi:hypothetical protein